MSDVIAIPTRPLMAVFLAFLMSVHTYLLQHMLREDTIEAEGWQVALILFGWFWWGYALWGLVE